MNKKSKFLSLGQKKDFLNRKSKHRDLYKDDTASLLAFLWLEDGWLFFCVQVPAGLDSRMQGFFHVNHDVCSFLFRGGPDDDDDRCMNMYILYNMYMCDESSRWLGQH